MKKIIVKKKPTIALTIHRPAMKVNHFVYIAVANKLIKYPAGASSRIVYIGQTKKGISRLAASAAERAPILDEHGISSLTFYLLVPNRHGGVESWKVLETALLSEFKALYGTPPKGNKQGTKFSIDHHSVIHARKFFIPERLSNIIRHYSHIGD